MDYHSILNTCYQFINSQTEIVLMVKYSHIIPIFLILFLGFFVLIKAKLNLFSRIFFIFIFIFAIWLIGDLILWTQSNYFLLYAVWAPLVFIEIIFYIFGIYFALLFINKNDISIITKTFLFLIALPPFVITVMGLSVTGFNQSICEANNNSFLDVYKLIAEAILLLVLLYYIIKSFLGKKDVKNKKSNIVVLGSMFLFLAIFGATEYISAITGIYEYNLYSLFLLPIFLLVIIYAVFELDIFHFNILGTQYLVVGLTILGTGQLFFVNGWTDRLLTILTVTMTVGLSIILFRNFKRESDQRIHIENLSLMLGQSKMRLEESKIEIEDVNEKLKSLDKLKTEFVSLASHQLRSPLTAIKGYTSMLLDGDYGEINKEAKETIKRVMESSNNLTLVVEDLLNVSKIESGGMKYEMTKFDLVEVASSMAKDLSVTVENKGLKLIFLSNGVNDCMVNGDKEKIRQIVLNFIDNSIKYTKTGEIKVKVERVNDKIVFSVADTGMGMTPEIKESLFQKFARGDGARMNTSGTGLGLYLAKQIVEAHKGRVWVESEGPGKGSTFFMELDALK